MTELSVSLSIPILRAALFFKHKAYGHEEEYRFFSNCSWRGRWSLILSIETVHIP
jgi:hypothetical protein